MRGDELNSPARVSSAKVFRPDIQFIRGLSVLAVLFFHAKDSVFRAGYLGVDVFFVISGFVVTPLIIRIFEGDSSQDVRARWSDFYRRRFLRLAPALSFTLSFTALGIFLFGSPVDFVKLAKQGFATLFLAGNLGAYWISGDYFYSNPNSLIHTWSLSVEEQFYILLPVLIFLFISVRKDVAHKAVKILIAASVVSLAFFAFSSELISGLRHAGIVVRPEIAFYSPLPRVWEFCIGGIVYLLQERISSKLTGITSFLRWMSPALLILLLFAPHDLGSKLGSLFACLLTSAAISVRGFDVFGYRIKQVFIWLGDRSYSIYLLHMPLLFLAKYSSLGNLGVRRAIPTSIAVALSFVLGHLSYTKIEERFRHRDSTSREVPEIRKLAIVLFAIPSIFLGSLLGISHFHPWNWGTPPITAEWGAFPDKRCEKLSSSLLPCIYGSDSSKGTVVLVGDSHAQMLARAVKDSATHSNWNSVLWGQSACAFELGNLAQPPADDCERSNRERLSWIKQHKPDAVIFSTFVLVELNSARREYSLLQLQKVVPNILIVLTDPIYPDNDEFVDPRPVLISRFIPPKSLPLSKMRSDMYAANASFASWAKAHGIQVLDPAPFFCNTEKCWRYANGSWLYIDDDHFSVAGAKLLEPSFEDFLANQTPELKRGTVAQPQ